MESEVKQGFDLKVMHRDEKTGLVTHTNPYTLRVVEAPTGGKRQLFERPVGSGNLWDKANKPFGRWVKGKHVPDAEHVQFDMPETHDQKVARAMTEQQVKIAELEKELNSIKSENKKKKES